METTLVEMLIDSYKRYERYARKNLPFVCPLDDYLRDVCERANLSVEVVRQALDVPLPNRPPF